MFKKLSSRDDFGKMNKYRSIVNSYPDISTGLLLHLKYPPGVAAAGSWKDYSGNGNDATLVDGAYVDGNGLNLDGSGDYASVADNDQLSALNTLTISLWVNTTDAVDYKCLINKAIWSSALEWTILLVSGTPKIWFYNGGSTAACDAIISDVVNDGKWNQIIVSYSGTVASIGIMLNRVAKTPTTSGSNATIANTAQPVLIGRMGGFTARDLNGKIDNVRIYNRVLTTEQKQFLYDHEKTRYL